MAAPGTTASVGGPEANPLILAHAAWRARTPLVCRRLCEVLVAIYVLSWLVDVDGPTANIPYLVVRKFQVWRLALSPLGGNSLLLTVLTLLTIGDGTGPRLERSFGSTRLLALVGVSVAAVNVGFVAVCYGRAWLAGDAGATVEACAGFIWVVLSLIAVETLTSPSDGPRRLCCVDVPRDSYPLALGALWWLLSGSLVAPALALAVGYAEARGVLEAHLFTPYAAKVADADAWLADHFAGADWVSSRHALGAAAWVPEHHHAHGNDSNTAQPTMAALRSRFSGFVNSTLQSPASDAVERPAFSSSSSPREAAAAAATTGYVLGTVAGSPVAAPASPAASRKTSSQNRAEILAAVEARTYAANRV